jgi:hypothetical protein
LLLLHPVCCSGIAVPLMMVLCLELVSWYSTISRITAMQLQQTEQQQQQQCPGLDEGHRWAGVSVQI